MATLNLFRPKWKHSDPIKRMAVVRKLKNQGVLAEVSKNDEDFRVRREAVWKLNDQKLLAKIAKNDKEKAVKQAAIGKLKDQGVLTEIVKNDEDWEVRREAVWQLNDHKLLAEISKNDKEKMVRQAAIEKLKDQGVIAEIAKNDKEEYDLRITSNLEKDFLSILAATDSEQILITSSRGIQLQDLARNIQKVIKDGKLEEAEVHLITGEHPARWKEGLKIIRDNIHTNPRQKRIIFAQGIRPPFTDLFASSTIDFKSTVIRTDLTGYQRLLETAKMVNTSGMASGSFYCLVPYKEQSDISMGEIDRLGQLKNNSDIAKELLKFSHKLETYLTDKWKKELAKRDLIYIKKLQEHAELLRIKGHRSIDEFLDKFIEGTVTSLMWEEGCKYWVRKDSMGNYLSHDACDRDGIALPGFGFADMVIEAMIAVKHGGGTPELQEIWRIVVNKVTK